MKAKTKSRLVKMNTVKGQSYQLPWSGHYLFSDLVFKDETRVTAVFDLAKSASDNAPETVSIDMPKLSKPFFASEKSYLGKILFASLAHHLCPEDIEGELDTLVEKMTDRKWEVCSVKVSSSNGKISVEAAHSKTKFCSQPW